MADTLQILCRYTEPNLIQHAIECVVDILKRFCNNEIDASNILTKLYREEI